MMRLPLLFGLICAATLASASPPVFSVHDLDRDGHLSREEYAVLRTHCAERRGERCKTALIAFETLDTNMDGRIAEDELLETLGRRHRGGRGY